MKRGINHFIVAFPHLALSALINTADGKFERHARPNHPLHNGQRVCTSSPRNCVSYGFASCTLGDTRLPLVHSSTLKRSASMYVARSPVSSARNRFLQLSASPMENFQSFGVISTDAPQSTQRLSYADFNQCRGQARLRSGWSCGVYGKEYPCELPIHSIVK